MAHIVIIGNGVAGVTAARHIRKRSDDQITIISGETDHFFSRTALMYIFMGHMKYENTKPYEDWFWKKNKIELLKAWISEIDFDNKILTCQSSTKVPYDKLIIATGSKTNKFGWPGQDLKGVQGLYSFQDLETLEENAKRTKNAVIIGGGLIGIELAEMLISRGIKVTFLVREHCFWGNVLPVEEGKFVSRLVMEHHIDLKLKTELSEILSDEIGRVKGIITNHGEELKCEIVGLAPGVSPNIDFLKNTKLELDRGVLVDEFLQTNIPGVYAIGDCAQLKKPPGRRGSIEPVWYVGRMMGETVASTITDDKLKYDPGIWFNSAKFFDVEYQTYGWVYPMPKDNEATFYWEEKSKKACVKIVWDKHNKAVQGINVFGIRMRHEVWERWLKENKSIDYVMAHLKDANFDPEFYMGFEKEIIAKFNIENDASIKLKKASWKRIVGLIK